MDSLLVCVLCYTGRVPNTVLAPYLFDDPRIPFYAYLRLLFLLYLVLPQNYGARVLYREYIHPWMTDNEAAIDNFITLAYGRLRVAGIAYFMHAVQLLKVNVLGMLPSEDPSPLRGRPRRRRAPRRPRNSSIRSQDCSLEWGTISLLKP